MNKKVAFTTSCPVEVIYAAGLTPVDINNIFVLNDPENMVKSAELSGFPRNICAWIKGMYTTIHAHDIDTLIGIVQGDCSNTHSLMSILADEKYEVIPFSYPYYTKMKHSPSIVSPLSQISEKDSYRYFLDREIQKIESVFGTTRPDTQKMKTKLDAIRKKLIILDDMTWQTNQVTAQENHLWLVTSSDFNSDYDRYSHDLDVLIEVAKERTPIRSKLRLGYIGVPPILTDIYSFIEKCSARVVFNEVQRQFSMPYLEEDILEQYLRFTYPHSIFERIADIKTEIVRRGINGLIAYTQSFCHRQLDILSLKRHLDLPILLLEADMPGVLDARTKLRIESFIEMIEDNN